MYSIDVLILNEGIHFIHKLFIVFYIPNFKTLCVVEFGIILYRLGRFHLPVKRSMKQNN